LHCLRGEYCFRSVVTIDCILRDGSSIQACQPYHSQIQRLIMKKRRSKTLEKVARTVHDADEFIEHVFGIAAAYRAQHLLESSAKGAEIRKALKAFDKQATALDLWLRQALKPSQATAEHEALEQLSTALHGSPLPARSQAQTTQLWLASLVSVSERALLSLKRSPVQRAPRAAADALRTTFQHHGVKISYRSGEDNPSDAIRLFCAIAKDAGDSLTAEQARLLLKDKASI
jgi:hypothetical protein